VGPEVATCSNYLRKQLTFVKTDRITMMLGECSPETPRYVRRNPFLGRRGGSSDRSYSSDSSDHIFGNSTVGQASKVPPTETEDETLHSLGDTEAGFSSNGLMLDEDSSDGLPCVHRKLDRNSKSPRSSKSGPGDDEQSSDGHDEDDRSSEKLKRRARQPSGPKLDLGLVAESGLLIRRSRKQPE
jgi:hypothetical protein